MSRHRYAPRAIITDYARAGIGMALCLVPLAAVEAGASGTAVLAGLASLFAVYFIRTLQRHRMHIELSDEGVARNREIALRWKELEGLKLGFFPTKRDRSDGWMQLRLTGGGKRLRVDSQLMGFDDLVARAASAARANGVTLSAATESNLAALGIIAPNGPGSKEG